MNAKSTSYKAALYMRLSKDDEGTGESSSITNQRNMLTAYAKEHGFLIASEYVDDGYSGTSFDRPAFRRLIEDIEAKKINLVLTKDLSRLGRDYIQTGQYTEVYFPSKKVRYIAVNDGFDSESPYTDIAPFKNVVNEMYARDTSKKIRSAFAVKIRNGNYIGNFAPYGYRKDPNDKNHLLPDENSAAVVREIFRMAADGENPAAIAAELNGRGVLSPALYRCAKHPNLDEDAYSKRKEWTAATVAKFLRSKTYLGHMVQGKTTKISFKSKMTLRNPKCDWVVVEHTHQPLVEEEQFELVQKRLQSRTRTAKGQFSNLFSGLAKCADCGRNMSTVGTRKKGSPANLACGGYKLYGGQECSNHFIDYNVLYHIVLDAMREQLRLTEDEREALYRELCDQLREEIDDEGRRSELGRLRAESEKLDRLIEQLYDDNLNGRLAEERFYKLLQKYERRSGVLGEKICELDISEDREGEAQKLREAFDRMAGEMKRYSEVPELTENLLFDLIDRIEVEQGRYEQGEHGRVKRQDIRIYFRFMTQAQTREVLM